MTSEVAGKSQRFNWPILAGALPQMQAKEQRQLRGHGRDGVSREFYILQHFIGHLLEFAGERKPDGCFTAESVGHVNVPEQQLMLGRR